MDESGASVCRKAAAWVPDKHERDLVFAYSRPVLFKGQWFFKNLVTVQSHPILSKKSQSWKNEWYYWNGAVVNGNEQYISLMLSGSSDQSYKTSFIVFYTLAKWIIVFVSGKHNSAPSYGWISSQCLPKGGSMGSRQAWARFGFCLFLVLFFWKDCDFFKISLPFILIPFS